MESRRFGTGRAMVAMSLASIAASSIGITDRRIKPVVVDAPTGDFSDLEKRTAGTIYTPGKPYSHRSKPGKRRGENREQYRERLRTSGFL